jgi:hypothetical protein
LFFDIIEQNECIPLQFLGKLHDELVSSLVRDNPFNFFLIGSPFEGSTICVGMINAQALDLKFRQDVFIDEIFGASYLIDWSEKPLDD